MFDKDGDFDIELATGDDIKKIIGISKWLERRMDDIPGEIVDHYFREDGSLHMNIYSCPNYNGASGETKEYIIPREIFFAHSSLYDWFKEQDDREKKRFNAEKKRSEIAAAAERKEKRDAAKEKRDIADYKRLKAKFEGAE